MVISCNVVVFPTESLLVSRDFQTHLQDDLALPPVFGRSVNPIQTRREILCPIHYYLPPWIFKPVADPVVPWYI